MSLLAAFVLVAAAGSARAQAFYPKETETYLLNYQVEAKSQATATLLSLTLGFGTGHFYSGDYLTGGVMAGGQVLGLGLFGLSTAFDAGTGQTVMMGLAGALFVGFRIADAFMAPLAARDFNRHLAKRLKIKYLALPSQPPAGEPQRLAMALALEGSF